jgi:hypothetical protein
MTGMWPISSKQTWMNNITEMILFPRRTIRSVSREQHVLRVHILCFQTSSILESLSWKGPLDPVLNHCVRRIHFNMYTVFIVQAYQTSQYVVPRGGIFLGKWHSSFAGSSVSLRSEHPISLRPCLDLPRGSPFIPPNSCFQISRKKIWPSCLKFGYHIYSQDEKVCLQLVAQSRSFVTVTLNGL